jgi:hypothetical protein
MPVRVMESGDDIRANQSPGTVTFTSVENPIESASWYHQTF